MDKKITLLLVELNDKKKERKKPKKKRSISKNIYKYPWELEFPSWVASFWKGTIMAGLDAEPEKNLGC